MPSYNVAAVADSNPARLQARTPALMCRTLRKERRDSPASDSSRGEINNPQDVTVTTVDLDDAEPRSWSWCLTKQNQQSQTAVATEQTKSQTAVADCNAPAGLMRPKAKQQSRVVNGALKRGTIQERKDNLGYLERQAARVQDAFDNDSKIADPDDDK